MQLPEAFKVYASIIPKKLLSLQDLWVRKKKRVIINRTIEQGKKKKRATNTFINKHLIVYKP